MKLEIERKFLVEKSLWENLDKGEGEYLHQCYILTDPKKTIRIRITPSKGILTIKGQTNSISRPEFEYEIPKTDASELLNLFAPNNIEKYRYKIMFENKLWEVDVFKGDNEGLIVAEIELQSEDEGISKPDWVGKEVTEDTRYLNSNLSTNPFKNWK